MHMIWSTLIASFTGPVTILLLAKPFLKKELKEREEHFERMKVLISGYTDNLHDIINEFMDHARSESASLKIRVVDLEFALKNAVSRIEQLEESANYRFGTIKKSLDILDEVEHVGAPCLPGNMEERTE